MIFSSVTDEISIWEKGSGYCSADELIAFRKEVEDEIRREEGLLLRVKKRERGQVLGTLIACILILIGAALIFLKPSVLLLWMVVGILLYSYNFVILLIPTTTVEKTKIKDRTDIKQLYIQFKEIATHLIFKRKRLAIEVGLTVFLGGMVPLALSFSIIFSIALVNTIIFAYFTNTLSVQLAGDIAVQIALILMFYTLMLLLEPHAQGITKLAKSTRDRLKETRSNNKLEFGLMAVLVGGMLLVCVALFFGAILLPGSTLFEILSGKFIPFVVDVPDLLVVLVTQLFIMRHFQGVSSRRMAASLLTGRIKELRKDVLEPLNRCISGDGTESEDEFVPDLGAIKNKYCGLAIYDVTEQNFFGYGSIFLVAPRLRYALDDEVLACAIQE